RPLSRGLARRSRAVVSSSASERGGDMTPSNTTKRAMPKIPKPDEEAKEFFRSVVPEEPDVAIRPMFGNVSGFVNGNMFMGLFGNGLFLRLPDGERDQVMAGGGSSFEPMPGRPM